MCPRRPDGSRTPAATCGGCLAWGAFTGSLCPACYLFSRSHAPGVCGACRCRQPLKAGYCRLCWCQARLNVRAATGKPSSAGTVMPPHLRQVRHHQLFFVGMHHHRGASTTPPRRHDRRGAPRKPPPPVAGRPQQRWSQPALFDGVHRDYHRFNHHDGQEPDNPWLAWARHVAHTRAEARGWPRGVRSEVERALVMLLAGYADGGVVRHSEIFTPLRARRLSVERTTEVLQTMGVFLDDRPPPLQDWLDRRLDGLAPGIRDAAHRWSRTLRDGSPRTRPRDEATVRSYLNAAHPALLEWSTRYGHLREVTRDDVLAHVKALQGHERQQALVALRSLFAWAKKNGLVFANPTSRIKVGQLQHTVLQPLTSEQTARSIRAATTPAARLALALAAVHAARPGAIRALQLDDVDLGNCRLTITGRTRPLDDLTHQALLSWLEQRRQRWPDTANPHLLINSKTALETGPVSRFWLDQALRGQVATLERLRMDRQLEEALAHGPDPLHLAAVFGLDDKTAIRYAHAARQLLESPAE